jgi:hypothetical protein
LNPWLWHVPILITMPMLILVFLLLEGYFKKLKFLGISSAIACGLFVVYIVLASSPALLKVTGIKIVGYVVSFLVNWPMIALNTILNLENITWHSYQPVMLLWIGLFLVNTFTIFGITRLVLYIKYKDSAKRLRVKQAI